MSEMTLAVGRPTLADRLFARSLATDVVLILAGVALTGGAAQIAIPMWPVPLTAQTFAVLLVGTMLGATRGGICLLLYAAFGILGVPLFAGGGSGWSALASPSGGYIIGFVLAAILTGWLAQRAWDRRIVGTLTSFLAGSAAIYLVGLPWLGVALGELGEPHGVPAILASGLAPFIPGDIIKAIVAAAVLPLLWRATGPRSAR